MSVVDVLGLNQCYSTLLKRRAKLLKSGKRLHEVAIKIWLEWKKWPKRRKNGQKLSGNLENSPNVAKMV